MGRAPCCDKANVKKGPWSPEEDDLLKNYIHKNGTGGNWISLPHRAGLKRCGKSCRLRWLNYLRPNIKHGEFSDEEDMIICTLYSSMGSRWSVIAAQLPGRTDNDIKNYWNTKLKKKLISTMSNFNIEPQLISHHKITSNSSSPSISSPSQFNNNNSNNTDLNYYTAFNQSTPLLGISSNSLSASTILQRQSNFPVFAGAPEPSCSSSEATNGSYFYNGSSSMEEDNKAQIKSELLNWEEQAPLVDYGLEEIKQLITTSTGNSFYY